MLISTYLANRLGLKLGDRCQAIFLKDESAQVPSQRSFVIVGLYNSGFQEFDASYLFVDLRQIQHINKWKADEIGTFELFIDDFNHITEVGNEVYARTNSHLDSQTILQKYPFIFEWLSMFDFNIYLIIGIMLIVGVFNMITALLVLILEKTPMVGNPQKPRCCRPQHTQHLPLQCHIHHHFGLTLGQWHWLCAALATTAIRHSEVRPRHLLRQSGAYCHSVGRRLRW